MKKKLAIVAATLGLAFALTARAELVIRITEGVKDGIPVMIVPFQGSDLASVIEADLMRSGRFTLIDPARAGQALAPGLPYDVPKLRSSGAEYVIVGKQTGTLEFEILNAATGQRVSGFRIPQHPNRRRMAHKAADLVFERLTGTRGAFDTRIAYVAANGAPRHQTYQLIVADSDGFNPRTVMTSNQPILSPSWSPDGRRLAYVSFETDRSAIYIQDLATGEKRSVSNRTGTNGAPSWSPDGQSLAVSLSENGNPDIFVMDASGNNLRQITHSDAIDTEPTWANSSTIVYTSDQSGKPQLYRTSAAGGDGTRMTFEGSYNSAPSIVGNQVAMVRQVDGDFRIALMSASSRKSSIISNGRFDEAPTIAPNGSMVLYATKREGRSMLAVSSANGKAQQTLSADNGGDVREPAWSNYLD